MVSSLTEKGCEVTLRALELGAVDVVTKPKIDVRSGTIELAEEILAKVKTAARVRVQAKHRALGNGQTHGLPHKSGVLLKSTHKVSAIGASTGGTEALRDFL